MEQILIIIIIANVIFSYLGFRDQQLFNKYMFEVDGILVHKEYIRLLSSGFLHGSWIHLLFNMVVMYSFGEALLFSIGISKFFAIYFVSLILGNLFSLLIHRNHGDYSAIGASGAVSGLVFASILIEPNAKIGFLFVPGILFPGWVIGLGFILYSIYGIKKSSDNIGHEAHLGGAIAGLIVCGLMNPSLLVDNFWVFLILLVPSLIFLILIIYKPEILLIDIHFGKNKSGKLPKEQIINKEAELNRILDKIKDHGSQSLTQKERDFLEKYG